MAALEGAFVLFFFFLIFGVKSSFITLKCTLQKKKGLVNGVFNFGEFYLFVFYLVLSGVD